MLLSLLCIHECVCICTSKASLKLSIQKTKIMASNPITLWQIEGGKVETVTDLVFLGFKITADSDCSQEIEIILLLGKKAVTKLDSVLKDRNITLLTKSLIVKAMVFPVVMYRYKRWIIRKSVKVIAIQSCPTLFDPWTAARQAPLSMEFLRQEYRSGFPFPSPGDLPNPGIEPISAAVHVESTI